MVDQTLDKLAEAKIFHLVITGGEPLANKPVLFSFLKGVEARKLTCGINSTLSGLTKSDAEYFQESGVMNVLISILGSDEKKHDAITQSRGSFSRTIDGIKILKNTNIPISANMVVSALNIDDIIPTSILVKSLGFKKFFITRAACPSNCIDFNELRLTREQFTGYLKELHAIQERMGLRTGFLECYPLCGMKELLRYSSFLGRKCLAGITSMTIGPTGEARPCSHLDKVYGNIFKENIREVWSRMTEWRHQSLLPDICKSCRIVNYCGGGCRMEAKTLGGGINEIDPFAEPANVEYATEQLAILHRRKLAKKDELPKFCRINPSLRVRNESFGGVFFVGDKSSGLVESPVMDFVGRLDKRQIYEVDFLTAEINRSLSSVNITKFLNRMFKEKIFVAISGDHV
jgi:radical SAM protein with 4Fe4S-binding SPASM domain